MIVEIEELNLKFNLKITKENSTAMLLSGCCETEMRGWQPLFCDKCKKTFDSLGYMAGICIGEDSIDGITEWILARSDKDLNCLDAILESHSLLLNLTQIDREMRMNLNKLYNLGLSPESVCIG